MAAQPQLRDSGERLERTSMATRLAGVFGLVLALNLVGWGLLLYAAPSYPTLLGLGALAYSFGLRHAFDADHIAAIDNTTRKLLQQGRRPMGVGLFFSLGHSTVVFVMAVALALAAGFDAGRTYLHGNAKSARELREALGRHRGGHRRDLHQGKKSDCDMDDVRRLRGDKNHDTVSLA